MNGEKSEKERKLAIKSNLNECKTYKIKLNIKKLNIFFFFYSIPFYSLSSMVSDILILSEIEKKKVATITIVKIKIKMALP